MRVRTTTLCNTSQACPFLERIIHCGVGFINALLVQGLTNSRRQFATATRNCVPAPGSTPMCTEITISFQFLCDTVLSPQLSPTDFNAKSRTVDFNAKSPPIDLIIKTPLMDFNAKSCPIALRALSHGSVFAAKIALLKRYKKKPSIEINWKRCKNSVKSR